MDADRRIEELERRLARYHEQLETAIEQRDRYVLKSAWRVLRLVIVAGVFVGAIAGMAHWAPNASWLVAAAIAVGAAVVAFIFSGLIGVYLERAEADNAGKFWRLPRWAKDD